MVAAGEPVITAPVYARHIVGPATLGHGVVVGGAERQDTSRGARSLVVVTFKDSAAWTAFVDAQAGAHWAHNRVAGSAGTVMECYFLRKKYCLSAISGKARP